jgi:hypothetical protein
VGRAGAADQQRRHLCRGSPTEGGCMSAIQNQAPLTIFVEAKELCPGDWVVARGIIEHIGKKWNGKLAVIFKNDNALYLSTDQVEVRIEDHGEADEWRKEPT